jgi:ribosomal-protein-alanine N-acetyltransferase
VIADDVAVRLAEPADAPAIAAMSRDLIEHGLPWRWRAPRITRSIAAEDTNVAVVGPRGAPTAFGIMNYRDDDAHLLLFAVRPEHQRRGIGSALLAWLEAVARCAGVQRIVVESRHENVAARSFYNEHGYHEREIAHRMYSGRVDGVRLEKWLRAAGGSAAAG